MEPGSFRPEPGIEVGARVEAEFSPCPLWRYHESCWCARARDVVDRGHGAKHSCNGIEHSCSTTADPRADVEDSMPVPWRLCRRNKSFGDRLERHVVLDVASTRMQHRRAPTETGFDE